MADCNDCTPNALIKDLKQEFSEYKRSVDERFTEQGRRVGEVEKAVEAHNRDYEWIKLSIGEIKTSMREIVTSLSLLENRPGNVAVKSYIYIFGAIATTIVGVVVGKFIK